MIGLVILLSFLLFFFSHSFSILHSFFLFSIFLSLLLFFVKAFIQFCSFQPFCCLCPFYCLFLLLLPLFNLPPILNSFISFIHFQTFILSFYPFLLTLFLSCTSFCTFIFINFIPLYCFYSIFVVGLCILTPFTSEFYCEN